MSDEQKKKHSDFASKSHLLAPKTLLKLHLPVVPAIISSSSSGANGPVA